MRWWRFAIILLVMTLLNSGNLLNMISVGSGEIRPDLLLIFLVVLASRYNSFEAIIASFAIGFAADISSTVIGPYIISFGLFGSLISQMRRVMILKRAVHRGGMIFVTALLTGGLAQILTVIKAGQGTPNVFGVLLPTAIYSAIIGPMAWLLFSRVLEWTATQGDYRGRVGGR